VYRIKKTWSAINNYFLNLALLKKLTIAYTIAILIPAIAAASYTYVQSMSSIKQEMARGSERSLMQIENDIDRKVTIVSDIANNIAYNTKIQNLLFYGMEFTPEAINYFINSIASPIEYALNFNEANIYQVRVYFSRENIPEQAHFLREERLRGEEWYREFKVSSNEELWIYPAKSSKANNIAGSELDKAKDIPGDTNVFRMVKKIREISGTYLGVAVIDILEEDLLSSLKVSVKNDEFFVINWSGDIVYPHEYEKDKIITEQDLNNMTDEKGYLFSGNMLYSYKAVEPLNIRIINKVPIEGLIKSTLLASGYNILTVVLGIIILEIITYYTLKIIFSRLNQIVKIMNVVVMGNFDIRIPVLQRDEVGKIALSFNVLIEKINSLINDVIKKETAQKDAQLAALQYQINPHFIYNTIDIFRMRLELEGNYDMSDSISYFGRMLRYNINRDSQYATIKEEVEYIEKYIHLQRLRYEDKLNFQANIPNGFENIKIIRFMLQPIIENSIKHGIKGLERALYIEIIFEKKGDKLQIQVFDNGSGIESEKLKLLNEQLRKSKALEKKNSTDKNIGLENINSRIKLFYGEQYYIKMESVKEQWTKVIINIPYDLN
jgi:two-component system, sensor histidine kinase YesM